MAPYIMGTNCLNLKMPNKNLHLTVKSVTFFAIAKTAPLFTSAEVKR